MTPGRYLGHHLLDRGAIQARTLCIFVSHGMEWRSIEGRCLLSRFRHIGQLPTACRYVRELVRERVKQTTTLTADKLVDMPSNTQGRKDENGCPRNALPSYQNQFLINTTSFFEAGRSRSSCTRLIGQRPGAALVELWSRMHWLPVAEGPAQRGHLLAGVGARQQAVGNAQKKQDTKVLLCLRFLAASRAVLCVCVSLSLVSSRCLLWLCLLPFPLLSPGGADPITEPLWRYPSLPSPSLQERISDWSYDGHVGMDSAAYGVVSIETFLVSLYCISVVLQQSWLLFFCVEASW